MAGGEQAGHRGGRGAQKCVSFSVMAATAPSPLSLASQSLTATVRGPAPSVPRIFRSALGIINLRNLYTVGEEKSCLRRAAVGVPGGPASATLLRAEGHGNSRPGLQLCPGQCVDLEIYFPPPPRDMGTTGYQRWVRKERMNSCLPCTWPAAGDQDAGAIPRPHPSFLGRLRMGSESLLGLATCGASHLTPLSHAVPPVRWASCSSCRLCCEGELHHLQGHLYSGLCINGYVSHRRPSSCPSSPSREQEVCV